MLTFGAEKEEYVAFQEGRECRSFTHLSRGKATGPEGGGGGGGPVTVVGARKGFRGGGREGGGGGEGERRRDQRGKGSAPERRVHVKEKGIPGEGSVLRGRGVRHIGRGRDGEGGEVS